MQCAAPRHAPENTRMGRAALLRPGLATVSHAAQPLSTCDPAGPESEVFQSRLEHLLRVPADRRSCKSRGTRGRPRADWL